MKNHRGGSGGWRDVRVVAWIMGEFLDFLHALRHIYTLLFAVGHNVWEFAVGDQRWWRRLGAGRRFAMDVEQSVPVTGVGAQNTKSATLPILYTEPDTSLRSFRRVVSLEDGPLGRPESRARLARMAERLGVDP